MVFGLVLALFLRAMLGADFFDAFLLAILFFSVYEVMRATKAKDRGIKYHYVFIFLVIAYLVFFVGNTLDQRFGLLGHILAQLVIILIFIIYTFFMYYVDSGYIKQCMLKKKNVGSESRQVVIDYLKIIAYPTAFIFALFLISHMDDAAPSNISIGLLGLVLVFVISAATDTFAYAVGITLKGPKLCPKISPKKTWAGAIGGLFGGVIGSLTLLLIASSDPALGSYFLGKGIDANWALVVFGVIGLLGSIATQAGDIFASFIKRRHGVKDYGKILPGHGGVMDRIDGNIFCAVFILIALTIICYIL